MTLSSFCVAVAIAATGFAGARAQESAAAGHDTFHVMVTATGRGAAAGQLTVPMTIRIDRYTPEHARVTMTDALKYRGYPGFLLALRDAPRAGALDIAGQTFVIRWAQQVAAGAGRTITIVTEKPVFFLGSGRPDAKPTKGYEVALVRLEVSGAGQGTGIMAAAARVKPDGAGGVKIDNYADTPMTLTIVPSTPQ